MNTIRATGDQLTFQTQLRKPIATYAHVQLHGRTTAAGQQTSPPNPPEPKTLPCAATTFSPDFPRNTVVYMHMGV
jgi:hypothetical protein